MKKERVDLVVSLGGGCACSRTLRERGLQYTSLPFDWLTKLADQPRAGIALRKTVDTLVGDFASWFKRENLDLRPELDSPKYLGVFDRGSELYFLHDLARGKSMEETYPEAAAKYQRRIARLEQLLARADKVVAVWITDPRDNGEVLEEDLKDVVAKLRKRWPKIDFQVLAFSCRKDVSLEQAEHIVGDGYESYAFDYRFFRGEPPSWEIRGELIAPILDRYEAVDYRTRAEKRANARREKAREYEKYRTTSAWQLLVRRLQYKVYRHFKRRLERCGVLKNLEPKE